MAKKSSKLFAGVLVSSILVSNCLFVYAKDIDAFEYVAYDDKDKSDKLNIRSISLKLNPITNTDNHTVLTLLNMNVADYKNQLKNGEELYSLLDKANAKPQYLDAAYLEYKQILENAVEGNAITSDEMQNLLSTYEKNIFV